MLKRENYLRRIRPYYDSEQIKALVGVRRSGKSTIMRQIEEEIKARISSDRIFYQDFEDYEAIIYKEDPLRFYRRIENFCKGKERCYVFLDEVHKMDDFENVLASIRSVLNCSVFVTSSSSKLMIGRMTKTLTGRIIPFYISPFQYSEVLDLIGEEDSQGLFDYYLEWGGFPLLYNEFRDNPKMYLNDLYDMILMQDIFNERGIRNKEEFKKLASYLLVHAGEIISVDSLSRFLGEHKSTLSQRACYDYISDLEDSFLLRICRRYDIRGKELLDMKHKYYPVDPGLISINNGNANINRAASLEDIIHNELVFRGYEVHVGKTYKGEVDFVAIKDRLKCYIQVAYSIADKDVCDREFNAFSSIRDFSPKYVMTLDGWDNSYDGIIHMNIRDFLTGRRDIQIS